MSGPPHPTRAALPGVPRRMWPYAVVIVSGGLCWLIVWGARLQASPGNASDDAVGFTGALMLLDIVLGVVAVAVLALRHRAPLTVAIVTTAILILSASAIGSAVVAVVHVAIAGTVAALTLTGVIWALAITGSGALAFAALGTTTSTAEAVILVLVGMLLYGALVAVGRYRRARAETVTLLRERAESAERERERAARTEREAERLRIAREMHDVLAHRMSIVSMHAGVLTYRDDLPREKITEVARVIQESTALALSELRGLLGVLRKTEPEDPHGPQPLLEHLPILLAETRAAGVEVEVCYCGVDAVDEQPTPTGLRETTSRAGYRIVQEALTNARKHAPGEAVHLRISRSERSLVIASRNRLPDKAVPNSSSPGMGLIGLAERARLAGGTLTTSNASGEFFLEGRLPWS